MNAFDTALQASSLQELAAQIERSKQAYLDLPRAGGNADDILAAKLAAAHRRAITQARLLALAEEEAAAGRLEPRELVTCLKALNLYVGPTDQERLARVLPDRLLMGEILAHQGQRLPEVPEHHLTAGPDVDLKIEVNRASAWPFSKWRNMAEFSEYAYEAEGVRYRGLYLRPGDVLLANVNLDGNSVYTSLSEPKGYCPHSAVFAILTADGKRFPAVIETYEKGLRAVPLNVFLNTRYVAYVEIYRHQGLDAEQCAQIGQAALEAIVDARGYNFYTCDVDRHYVSCTSLAQVLFDAVGLERVASVSSIGHPGIQKNLERLGYTRFDPFFAPVDFLLNRQFRCVGWVDNNHFPRLVARELVEAGFRRLFERGELTISRMPLMHHINHWGIGHMRRRTLLGKLISKVMGFDHLSLPRGPDPMLAIIAPVEADLGRAVERLMPHVHRHLADRESFDLRALLDDPETQSAITSAVRLRWL